MNYVIVLAGGVGTRFWPLSREMQPKQFLNIGSEKPMLEECLSRITPLIKKENIYILQPARRIMAAWDYALRGFV